MYCTVHANFSFFLFLFDNPTFKFFNLSLPPFFIIIFTQMLIYRRIPYHLSFRSNRFINFSTTTFLARSRPTIKRLSCNSSTFPDDLRAGNCDLLLGNKIWPILLLPLLLPYQSLQTTQRPPLAYRRCLGRHSHRLTKIKPFSLSTRRELSVGPIPFTKGATFIKGECSPFINFWVWALKTKED